MNLVALACVAALGFLLFGLGMVVSALRFRESTFFARASDPSDLLCKLVRAHGNTAEYAGFIAVLILYLGAHNPAQWVVWAVVAITSFRYLVAVGLVMSPTMAKPHPLRFVGALGTYLCGAALCVALIHGA